MIQDQNLANSLLLSSRMAPVTVQDS